MKKSLFFSGFILALSLFTSNVFAKSVTITWKGGTATVDLPDEVVELYNDNKQSVIDALNKNNVSKADFVDATKKINDEYKNISSRLSTSNPYNTTKKGLNDMSEVLVDTIPNVQLQQNVWAKAWIGLLTQVHFGVGFNLGVASFNVSSLKDTAKALNVDNVDDIPDSLVFPTMNGDVRLGGIVLPFDLGLSFSFLDTSKLGLDDQLKDNSLEYLAVGGDIRYALIGADSDYSLIKELPFQTTVSVGAGFNYTRGKLNINGEDYAKASLEFNTTTIFLTAQASAKFLIFVPFAGMKLMFSKSNVDWDVEANWNEILGTNTVGGQTDALKALLPSKFSGGASSEFGDHVRPVFNCGLGIDAGPIDITLGGSFDFVSQIGGAAFSLRVAL